MLSLTPSGAAAADAVAILIAGVRMVEDAHEALARERLEVARLASDSHWRSAAVARLRASLLEQRDRLDAVCADVVAHRDGLVREM